MSILSNLRQRLRPVSELPSEQRAVDAPVPGEPVSKKLLGKGCPASAAHQGVLGSNTWVSSMYSSAKRSPVNMIELFARYNPDVSQAVWNFLRLVNPGHTLEVKFADDLTKTDEEGLAILERRSSDAFGFGFYGRGYGGGLSVLLNILTFTLVTQGAVAAELEINDQLNDVLDWCPVDPRFIGVLKDEDTGHLSYFVWVAGVKVKLSPEQFRYVPLDPTVLNPYGRGPLDPTLETVFFQTEVLRDIKAVAHTQGHPRLHITLVEEMVKKHIPLHLQGSGQEEAARSWMNSYLQDLIDQYKNIEPDDALITYNMVNAEGLSAGQGAFRAESLVKIVEQQVISSTKQLPALLGRMEGSGLAHGTVQWQIFATTIHGLRDHVSKIASWWGTQTLRVLGRPSVAMVTFPPIRVQDRVKEAQAEKIETDTRAMWVQMGWESNDDAAMAMTGHKAVAEFPPPSPQPAPEQPGEVEMEEGDAEEIDEAEAMLGFTRGVKEFQRLDPWIRARIRANKNTINAQMDVRRANKFKEMEAEKGSPEHIAENGRHAR